MQRCKSVPTVQKHTKNIRSKSIKGPLFLLILTNLPCEEPMQVMRTLQNIYDSCTEKPCLLLTTCRLLP